MRNFSNDNYCYHYDLLYYAFIFYYTVIIISTLSCKSTRYLNLYLHVEIKKKKKTNKALSIKTPLFFFLRENYIYIRVIKLRTEVLGHDFAQHRVAHSRVRVQGD